MAPPNGVPPTTDNGVYMSTTTTVPVQPPANTPQTDTGVRDTPPGVCVNCKQNQKDDGAKDSLLNGELKEVPNNNVQIVKTKNITNGDTKYDHSKDIDNDELQEEADLVSQHTITCFRHVNLNQ